MRNFFSHQDQAWTLPAELSTTPEESPQYAIAQLAIKKWQSNV